MCGCSLEVDVGSLVGVGFMRYFVMRGLKMQLLLWYTLIDWLGVFCMVRVMYRECVIPWNQYCDSSLFVTGMKHETSCIVRKTVCIVRKGEKQIQILDGY
jgi:hypothetical protein